MVLLKNTLKAGVLTSLLLAPATIANAQEQEVIPQNITSKITESTYSNTVAVEESKTLLETMYKNLTDKSSMDDITIAESRFGGLQGAGFSEGEINFIKAKVAYVRAQKDLLTQIKTLGTNINKLTFTNSSLVLDVVTVNDEKTTFLTGYENVQQTFKIAVTNAPPTAVSAMLGLAVQYGHDETARKSYFKTNGADLDKLATITVAAEAAKGTTILLDELGATSDLTEVKTKVASITTAYNGLTADQKKIVESYNPNNDAETPYKKYKNIQTNLTAADKVSASILQLKGKQSTDFTTATSFIKEVTTIEAAYNKLNADAKSLVVDYQGFKAFKLAANVSEQIAALRVSNSEAYRTAVKAAETAYNDPDLTAKKDFVKNVSDLDIAVANIETAKTIEELIKGIEIATDKPAQITSARAAYDKPTAPAGTTINVADVKKIVNNLVTLTDWEKKYSTSLSVDNLIKALNPASSSFESLTIAAKAAFDRLDTAQQNLVQNKAKLELYFTYVDLSKKVNALKPTMSDYSTQISKLTGEVAALDAKGDVNATALDNIKMKLSEKLSSLSNIETALAEVISKISGLSKSSNLVQDMLAARASYDALEATTKKRVTNIKMLTDLEKSHKVVLNVIALVQKLDPTSKDYIKKAKSANTAYLKLDESKRVFVTNYDNGSLSNQVAAIGVIAQIDALKITKKTYKDDVLAAENAYAALKDQGLVTNYSALQAARGYITEAKAFDDRIDALANEPVDTFVAKVAALTAEYKAMNKNSKKLVEKAKTLSTYEKSNKDVVKVINLIAALNPNSKDYTKKVLAARKAYNALDEISQKRVTNYASLTAVEDVASLIGLIASLKPTSKTFLKDLETARVNYDALPENKKAAIINYEMLVKAETELTSAHTVIALIDVALPGEDDYLTKLMNARIAYDNLSSGQKKLVSNIKDLTNREREVKPILNVMVQIENLDPEQKNFVSKVNSARNAYDKLTKDQKKYVNNIAILQNYEPVSSVIELIGKLKSSSKTFHEDTIRARALYDALSEDSKQYVSNYYLLQAAETSILGASNVSRMINDLPSVDPKQYIKRIEEIRAAYNALPSDQKKAVENYHILQEQEKLLKPVISIVADIDKLMTSKDIESQYQKILKAYDKLSAMQRRYVYNEQIVLSLDSVINVVKSIAELKPSDKMYFSMIESARRDYNSLSSTDKQKVVNYSILLDAEENMSNVKKVVSIIAGLSTSSSTYVQDVANATAAYKALDSKLRGQVLNEDVLKKAEKDVAAVLKVVDAIAVIDPEDRSFEKKVSAAQKLYSGLTIEQQGLVYNYRVLQEYLDMQY